MPTPLDTLLSQSDPLVGDPSTPESHARLTELSAVLAREVVQADRTLKGRRLGLLRKHKWATAAIAALVVVPTSAYAASHFRAQTGQFGAEWTTNEEDGSEWIDTCAADFPEFVRTLKPRDEPLPAGETWDSVADFVITQRARSNGDGCSPDGFGGLAQTTGIRADYFFAAQGKWGCEAIKRANAGNTAGAHVAAKEAAAYFDREDSLGVFGDDDWKPMRDRLAAGDLAFVREYFTETDCS